MRISRRLRWRNARCWGTACHARRRLRHRARTDRRCWHRQCCARTSGGPTAPGTGAAPDAGCMVRSTKATLCQSQLACHTNCGNGACGTHATRAARRTYRHRAGKGWKHGHTHCPSPSKRRRLCTRTDGTAASGAIATTAGSHNAPKGGNIARRTDRDGNAGCGCISWSGDHGRTAPVGRSAGDSSTRGGTTCRRRVEAKCIRRACEASATRRPSIQARSRSSRCNRTQPAATSPLRRRAGRSRTRR